VTESLYRIQWRTSARDDLLKVIEYIGKESPTRAASFGKELHSKTPILAEFPEMGRLGRPGLSGYREMVLHPNYIVCYRILVDSRVVQILRLKHVARKF
jgi:addiction module RelE/StbE family toxin